MICNAARATRPGLAAGMLRVLCNGMSAVQRFHMDGEEQRCRAGCQDEPDSLTLQRMRSSLQFRGGMWQSEEAICRTTSPLRPF